MPLMPICSVPKLAMRYVVAKPLAIDGTWVFPLFIAANESGGSITLSYYCERLHRIFNKTDWTHFDANTVPTGDDELHRPIFVK